MPSSPTSAGGATDRPSPPPSPGRSPGSSSPTTQHDLSPRRLRGSVQVQLTITRPPPPLPEELVEQVLLRFPPDDPARLVRATLVCWSWRRLICGPSFRRRFREFHRAPPMLGFFVTNVRATSLFFRTAATCPPMRINSTAVDARHGRVLLHSKPFCHNPLEKPFVVWDPITDQRWELPLLPVVTRPDSWNASLDGACDHLDCHRGPFLVILVATNNDDLLSYVYSSESCVWSEPTSAHKPYCRLNRAPTALVGSALYFLNGFPEIVLKYDLGTRQISLIHLPENYYFYRFVLMTMEDGGLGFVTLVNSTLYLWSWEAGRETGDGWEESGFIDLVDLLPDGAVPSSLDVIGCTDSIGVVFLYSNVGTLTVDLKSRGVMRVCKCLLPDIYP